MQGTDQCELHGFISLMAPPDIVSLRVE